MTTGGPSLPKEHVFNHGQWELMAFQLRVHIPIIDDKAPLVHTGLWNKESTRNPVGLRFYNPALGFKLADLLFQNLFANTHSSKVFHRLRLCTLNWLKLALKIITPLVLVFLYFLPGVSAPGEDNLVVVCLHVPGCWVAQGLHVPPPRQGHTCRFLTGGRGVPAKGVLDPLSGGPTLLIIDLRKCSEAGSPGGRTDSTAPHPLAQVRAMGAFSHSANYYVVHPGSTPANHPPTEACMINSKQHRGCRTLGPMATGGEK